MQFDHYYVPIPNGLNPVMTNDEYTVLVYSVYVHCTHVQYSMLINTVLTNSIRAGFEIFQIFQD